MPPKPTVPDLHEIFPDLSVYDSEFTQDHIREVLATYNRKCVQPYYLAPLNDHYVDLTASLLDINVLIGTDGVGRKSCIRYANRQCRYPIVELNCRIFHTEHQFMNRLFMECSRVLGHVLPPYENISTYNLASLTPLIKQPLLLVIDHCEKLNDVKRQGVLYNLLEWVKKDVSKFVGLHLVTTDMKFFDGLEKRVRSRLTSKNFFFFPCRPEGVVDVMTRRLRSTLSHMKFIERLEKFFRRKEFFTFVEKTIQNTGSVVPYLEAFRNVLANMKPEDVRGFVDKHELAHLDKMQKEMADTLSRMQCLELSTQIQSLTGSFSTPAFTVLAVILNMIERKCQINLQTIFRNFVKIKMQLQDRQGIGSITEYGEGHISKGLGFLVENGYVTMEELPDGTVVVRQSLVQIKEALLASKVLPPLVRNIIECDGV